MKSYTANITIYYTTGAVTKDWTFKAEEGWKYIERIAALAEEKFNTQVVVNSLEEV